MLGDHDTIATLAVKDLQVARDFYEGVLGFSARGDAPEGVLYTAGSGAFLVYPSSFAGTNRATAMSFQVPGAGFDAEVDALRGHGVSSRPSTPPASAGTTASPRCGDDFRGVWFEDPDGNILNVETGVTPELTCGRTTAQAARERSRVVAASTAASVPVSSTSRCHTARTRPGPDGVRAHAVLEQGGDELRCAPTDRARRRARRCWSRRVAASTDAGAASAHAAAKRAARAWSSASRSTWWSRACSPAAARMPTCRIPAP